MTTDPAPIDPAFVSDEELIASYSGPAVLSNRILITNTVAGVRLAFMELQVGKVPSVFRAAVILGYQDALSLRDLITKQLKEIEDQLKAAAEMEKKAAEAKNG